MSLCRSNEGYLRNMYKKSHKINCVCDVQDFRTPTGEP